MNSKRSLLSVFSWVGVLFSLLTIQCCSSPNSEELQQHSSVRYSFFVAGHTYGKPGVDNVGLHPPFRDKYELISKDKHIDFGVLTGDIVLRGNTANWDEVDADIALLDRPVHFAVGNHDMTDRALYEARYGKTYASFIHQDDLCIILDPNLDHWNISGKQLEFLKETLDRDHKKVKNIFVFFHQALWWSADNKYNKLKLNSTQGRAADINFWSEVEPLFRTLPNQVYMFAGDVGANPTGSEFMYDAYDNITLIASGMGGEQRDNFIIVDVMEDKTVSFRLIALNSKDIDALGKLEDYVLP